MMFGYEDRRTDEERRRNLEKQDTPEEMLDRWAGISCTCDPDVGHLCECCHDTQVVRQLLIDMDCLRDCVDYQKRVIQELNEKVQQAGG